MKNYILAPLLFLLSTGVYSAKLIHPLDFDGTEAQKEKVIAYIENNVKETYSKIGMDNPSTLRMMEAEELKSFKQLTKIQNRQLLDGVIDKYCGIGMCGYNTFLMMYNEENKASKKTLEW